MDTDLLLSDVVDEVEEYGGAFPHHVSHVDAELAKKSTAEVLLSHANDSLDFLDGERRHTNIVQVDNHDPIFDQAWYKQLFDDKLTEEGSWCITNFDWRLDFDHLSDVQNYDWSEHFVSSTNIHEATFKNFSDLTKWYWEYLAQPSTMLDYVLQGLRVIVFLTGQESY